MEKSQGVPKFQVGDILVGTQPVGYQDAYYFFVVKSLVKKSGAPRVAQLRSIKVSEGCCGTQSTTHKKLDTSCIETTGIIYTARWSKTEEKWQIIYEKTNHKRCTLEKLENFDQIFEENRYY